MTVHKEPFGEVRGNGVDLYTLSNSDGFTVKITNYGGIITSILAKDKNEKFGDVVLGFDGVQGYLDNTGPYFGAIIGRYANRIAKGQFTLDGKQYTLPINNGPNSLHGGLLGFDKQIWTATVVDSDTPQLVLEYTSKDGEEGFPGELTTKVTYTVTTDNSLRIEYHATTNAPTVINLTNHSYFNLSAGRAKDALDHVLQLDADSFTPVDETSIPTGEIKSVKDTPYDFSSPQVIGTRIDQVDSGGYDHNWVINGTGLKHAATVYEPLSGRVLQVSTTHPGVQFYAGNYLDGMQGKQGKFIKRYGFCLETQHFPDSPNKPQFPSTVLRAGTAYDHVTIFKFSTRE